MACFNCSGRFSIGCEDHEFPETDCRNFDRTCITCDDFWCCSEADDDVRPNCLELGYADWSCDTAPSDEEAELRMKEMREHPSIWALPEPKEVS